MARIAVLTVETVPLREHDAGPSPICSSYPMFSSKVDRLVIFSASIQSNYRWLPLNLTIFDKPSYCLRSPNVACINMRTNLVIASFLVPELCSHKVLSFIHTHEKILDFDISRDTLPYVNVKSKSL